MNNRDFERLSQIKNEMEELLKEVKYLLRKEGLIFDRANSYWLAGIENYLSEPWSNKECTFVSTIREVAKKSAEDSIRKNEVDEDDYD